jgi:hypothetical protein
MSIRARRALFVLALVFAVVSAVALSVGASAPTEAQTTGGDTITPSQVTETLNAGDSVEVQKDVHLEALPAKADIVLAVDTTGSMGGAITQAKNEATQLVNDLQATIPGARFAVVDFKDYPFSPYGGTGDYPYLLRTGLTSDATTVQSAINGLSAVGGGDGPEAYNRAFYEAYSDAALDYDPGAEKFLVVLGDQTPHDPNLATVAPACGNRPPVDPGRDEVAGNSDDLLTQDTLQGLSDNDITMLMVKYNASISLDCYKQLAAKTGGSAVNSGTSLSQTITELVEANAKTIQNIELQFSEGCGLTASTDPASPLTGGPFTAPYDFSFTETIGVPNDATPGTKNCELNVVADGAIRATQTIDVTVPECTFSEILPPVNDVDSATDENMSAYKFGSRGVVPAKFQATCNGDLVDTQAEADAHPMALTLTKLGVPPALDAEVEDTQTGSANSGDLFRFDDADDHYIYNIGIKGKAKGTYRITISEADGAGSHDEWFSIK